MTLIAGIIIAVLLIGGIGFGVYRYRIRDVHGQGDQVDHEPVHATGGQPSLSSADPHTFNVTLLVC